MFIILFSFIFRFQRRRRTSGWSEKEVTVAAKQKAEVEEDLKMAAEVDTAKHELDRLTLIHAEAKSLLDSFNPVHGEIAGREKKASVASYVEGNRIDHKPDFFLPYVGIKDYCRVSQSIICY